MSTPGRLARRLLPLALMVACLAPGSPGTVQASTLDPRFSIVWEARVITGSGWTIDGFVHNETGERVTNVRVRVEGLDDAGQPVFNALGWVVGDIPPRGRGYFRVPARRHPGYRVAVASFVSLGEQAP